MRIMKNILKINTLGALLLTVTALVVLPSLETQASLKAPSFQTLSDKRCEKCKRGDDGKMVCEPVPCP